MGSNRSWALVLQLSHDDFVPFVRRLIALHEVLLRFVDDANGGLKMTSGSKYR